MVNDTLKSEAMKIAVPMIARFEGLRLDAYRDAVGIPTIGYGMTHYPTGRAVQMGDHITEQEALDGLEELVDDFMDHVMDTITVDVNAHELAAVTSLAYNIGIGAFRKSTLLRKLNQGDKPGAALEFHKWNRAGGRILAGLTTRRETEKQEFVA